jgi:hypothetical protein
MTNASPEGLRRFWFPTAIGFGFGVTARTRDEAEAMARQAAAQLRRAFEPLKVVEDVDVRTLDQGHVVPNMGAVNFPGVWFPRLKV